MIAIENARLFNEVQTKSRDLQEALRYQTGSANILNVIASSPTDVGPVLKAIVDSACDLCDAYDAMVSRRPYKEPWPVEKATAILVEESGKQFDPVNTKAIRLVVQASGLKQFDVF